jgi:ATP-dependent helicase HepA
VYVIECVAPAELDVERWLPQQPVRIVVDTRRVERASYAPDARSVAKAADRALDPARYRKILSTLVPPMRDAAEKLALERARDAAIAALAEAEQALRAEIERLRVLARVNPGVNPAEIDALGAELTKLHEVLPTARPRLDALRFVASADLLSLRA